MITPERVLLHRADKGLVISDEKLNILYENINFVHMKDVSFVLCEKNKPAVWSWAEGDLVEVLPKHLTRLSQEQIKKAIKGVYLTGSKEFRLASTGELIDTAKELIGFFGAVKVVL